jgi:hypothetical protein
MLSHMSKKLIVIIGSMIFMDKMNEVKERVMQLGFDVIAPSLTQEEIEIGADTFMDYVDSQGGLEKCQPENPIWVIKYEGMRQYFQYIEKADAVLVCNFDKGENTNRIGENTFIEMAVAFYLKKKLYILQKPPYQSEKIEEVLGMRPVFLDGDLSGVSV